MQWLIGINGPKVCQDLPYTITPLLTSLNCSCMAASFHEIMPPNSSDQAVFFQSVQFLAAWSETWCVVHCCCSLCSSQLYRVDNWVTSHFCQLTLISIDLSVLEGMSVTELQHSSLAPKCKLLNVWKSQEMLCICLCLAAGLCLIRLSSVALTGTDTMQ